MLTKPLSKTLTIAVTAGILAYAVGALAHDPHHYDDRKHYKNKHYSYPYSEPNRSNRWNFSFGLGSSYNGYRDRDYYDRNNYDQNYNRSRGFYYPDPRHGRLVYIPYHSVGPACNDYAHHRH